MKREAPDWLIENGKDGSLLVWVEGGKFLAGEKPAFEVGLPGFYLGLTCVTNAQYGRFVKETGHRAPSDSSWRSMPKDISRRVLRGGSWFNDDSDAFRCAYRNCNHAPARRLVDCGFRVARSSS